MEFVPHGNLQQSSATLVKLLVCLSTLLVGLVSSKVGLVLVIRIHVYAFVGSYRNTLAVYPDVECVFVLYTVPMWPVAQRVVCGGVGGFKQYSLFRPNPSDFMRSHQKVFIIQSLAHG